MQKQGKSIGKNCAYCHAVIKTGVKVVKCPECGTPHHKDCWEENKGCAVYGCGAKVIDIGVNKKDIAKKERKKIGKYTVSRRRSRLWALLIDGALLVIPFWLLFYILKIDFDEYSKSYLTSPLYCISIIIGLAYYTYLHGKYGQTIGKKIAKIKVIRANGQVLDYRRAFFRIALTSFVGLIPVANLIFSYADAGWAFFRKDRRSIHDLVVDTVVVDA
jgi:uncharacterized RDD family membrane protein YckC